MRETDPRNAATQIDLPRSTDERYVPGPDPRVGLILDSRYKLLENLGLLIFVVGAGSAIKFGVDKLRTPPATSPPKRVETVPASNVDLRGTWAGTYGPLGYATKLVIKNHDRNSLDGVLEQGTFRIAFKGTYDSKSRTLTMMQTEVLSGEGWNLGEDVGKLSADGKRISGSGKDPLGESLGITYRWSFMRK